MKSERFENVWDAICDTREESANLTARSGLMMRIEQIVKAEGWTQKEGAKRCGLTQPRMNDLMRGKIDKFSRDALVKIAASLGRKIRFELVAA